MTTQQLEAIRKQLILADDFEDLQRATVQLVDGLRDDVAPAPAAAVPEPVKQLLREGIDLLNDPNSVLDPRDWTREANKWL